MSSERGIAFARGIKNPKKPRLSFGRRIVCNLIEAGWDFGEEEKKKVLSSRLRDSRHAGGACFPQKPAG